MNKLSEAPIVNGQPVFASYPSIIYVTHHYDDFDVYFAVEMLAKYVPGRDWRWDTTNQQWKPLNTRGAIMQDVWLEFDWDYIDDPPARLSDEDLAKNPQNAHDVASAPTMSEAIQRLKQSVPVPPGVETIM